MSSPRFASLVALLAEGVDRNTERGVEGNDNQVALLAEGVDRNNITSFFRRVLEGRPPRGGRG